MPDYPAERYRVFGASDALGNPAILYRVKDLNNARLLIELANRHSGTDVGFYRACDAHIDVRWFNGATEILFCGHAALALAWWLRITPAKFRCAAFNYASEIKNGQITLRLPLLEPTEVERAPVDLNELTLSFDKVFFENTTRTLLVRCADAKALDAWRPQFDMLSRWSPEQVGALQLFVPGDHAYDGYLRYFAPWYGKPEDNATGSAMRALLPLLGPGKAGQILSVRQLSAAGGVLHLTRLSDTEFGLSGHVSHERLD